MANTHNLCSLFKAIANILRNKTDTTESIPAEEIPDKIISTFSHNLLVAIATNNCTVIKAKDLNGVTSIKAYAFAYCTKLTSVTLPSSVTSIDYTAFTGCTNLKTINVPWSSGAVSSAPWGATNATINYNYGG